MRSLSALSLRRSLCALSLCALSVSTLSLCVMVRKRLIVGASPATRSSTRIRSLSGPMYQHASPTCIEWTLLPAVGVPPPTGECLSSHDGLPDSLCALWDPEATCGGRRSEPHEVTWEAMVPQTRRVGVRGGFIWRLEVKHATACLRWRAEAAGGRERRLGSIGRTRLQGRRDCSP